MRGPRGCELTWLHRKAGPKCPRAPTGTAGGLEGWAPKSVREVAALRGGAGREWGLVSNCALLGLVFGQSLLVIKPHSTGVLPLGLNTKSASETRLIICKSTSNSGENTERGNIWLESQEPVRESNTWFGESRGSPDCGAEPAPRVTVRSGLKRLQDKLKIGTLQPRSVSATAR